MNLTVLSVGNECKYFENEGSSVYDSKEGRRLMYFQ